MLKLKLIPFEFDLTSTPKKEVSFPLSVPSNAVRSSALAEVISFSSCDTMIISSEWINKKIIV